MFATLHAGIGVKKTHSYARSLNLYRYLAFFKRFKILDTVCPKSGMCLGWSHYRVLLQVEDDLALRWYLDEAAAETWSVRTLQRNRLIAQALYDMGVIEHYGRGIKRIKEEFWCVMRADIFFQALPFFALSFRIAHLRTF